MENGNRTDILLNNEEQDLKTWRVVISKPLAISIIVSQFYYFTATSRAIRLKRKRARAWRKFT